MVGLVSVLVPVGVVPAVTPVTRDCSDKNFTPKAFLRWCDMHGVKRSGANLTEATYPSGALAAGGPRLPQLTHKRLNPPRALITDRTQPHQISPLGAKSQNSVRELKLADIEVVSDDF